MLSVNRLSMSVMAFSLRRPPWWLKDRGEGLGEERTSLLINRPYQSPVRAVAPFTGPTSALRGSQPVHRTHIGCTWQSTRPPYPQVASTRQEDGSKDGLKDGAKRPGASIRNAEHDPKST
jgi:hypothetical protein